MLVHSYAAQALIHSIESSRSTSMLTKVVQVTQRIWWCSTKEIFVQIELFQCPTVSQSGGNGSRKLVIVDQ